MEPDLPASPTPRKVKFAPKGQTTRKKPLPQKREVGGVGDDDDGEDEETNEILFRKVNEHLTRRRPQAEKKSSVQVVFSQEVASSSLKTYGTSKEGSAENASQDILALPSSTSTDWITESSQNTTGSSPKQKKRVYKEPWDYDHSYYPITLPLRRPYSGDPEVLDREEFGEAGAVSDYDESAINSALDLGLMETDAGIKMLFLHLPADLPFGQHPARAACKEASGSLKLPGHASAGLNSKEKAGSSAPYATVASSKAKEKEIRGSSLTVSGSAKGKDSVDNSMSSLRTNLSEESRSSELPAGHMGKMLVYKSGAVKLKLGDILYDVSTGSDCNFPQDVAAINTLDRECCVLGELYKRAVVTPDIDTLLIN